MRPQRADAPRNTPEGIPIAEPPTQDALAPARDTFLRDRGWIPTYPTSAGKRVPLVAKTPEDAVRLFRYVVPYAAPLFTKQSGRLYKELAKVPSPVQIDAIECLLTNYMVRAAKGDKPQHHLNRAVECAELMCRMKPYDAWYERLLLSALYARFGAQYGLPKVTWDLDDEDKQPCENNADCVRFLEIVCSGLEAGRGNYNWLAMLLNMLKLTRTTPVLLPMYMRLAQSLPRSQQSSSENMRESANNLWVWLEATVPEVTKAASRRDLPANINRPAFAATPYNQHRGIPVSSGPAVTVPIPPIAERLRNANDKYRWDLRAMEASEYNPICDEMEENVQCLKNINDRTRILELTESILKQVNHIRHVYVTGDLFEYAETALKKRFETALDLGQKDTNAYIAYIREATQHLEWALTCGPSELQTIIDMMSQDTEHRDIQVLRDELLPILEWVLENKKFHLESSKATAQQLLERCHERLEKTNGPANS